LGEGNKPVALSSSYLDLLLMVIGGAVVGRRIVHPDIGLLRPDLSGHMPQGLCIAMARPGRDAQSRAFAARRITALAGRT
jgi:hypothetical protein